MKIAIIGAGSAGLLAAASLAKNGNDVTVFEKASHVRTAGCGIMLLSEGLGIVGIDFPDLVTKLQSSGHPCNSYTFRNLKGGVINHIDVKDEYPKSYVIPRQKIVENLFLECVNHGVDFKFNAKCKSIHQDSSVAVVIFEDTSDWVGDIVIGADGIYSTVRRHIHPNVSPKYLGDLVWRGIVSDTEHCTDGNFTVYARGRGVYANAFDIGLGLTHWGFFIERELAPHETKLSCPDDTSIPESELDKIPAPMKRLITETSPEAITTNFSYDLDTLPYLNQGRVILIGDAAHAKSPTKALGMTAGFEDAVVLTACINNVSTTDIPVALKNYNDIRLPIVHKYQDDSRAISRKTGRKRKID